MPGRLSARLCASFYSNRPKDVMRTLRLIEKSCEPVKSAFAKHTRAQLFALQTCKETRDSWRALALLKLLDKHRAKLDVDHYNMAIDACAGVGGWRDAMETLKQMKSKGFQPDEATYNSVLHACAKASKKPVAAAKMATKVIKEMQDQKVSFSMEGRQAAIFLSAQAGMVNLERRMWLMEADALCTEANLQNWHKVLEILGRIERGGNLAKLVLSQHSDGLLHAFNACKQSRLPFRALAMLHWLGRFPAKLEPVHFNFAIGACAHVGRWVDAQATLQLMKAKGLSPDSKSYSTALQACAKAKRPASADAAADLLAQMRRLGVPLDLFGRFAAINAFSHGGRPQDVFRLWLDSVRLAKAAKEGGDDPRLFVNARIGGAVLAACYSIGDTEMAQHVARQLAGLGVRLCLEKHDGASVDKTLFFSRCAQVSLDGHGAAALVVGLAKAKQFQDIAALFRHSEDSLAPPNSSILMQSLVPLAVARSTRVITAGMVNYNKNATPRQHISIPGFVIFAGRICPRGEAG